MGAVDVKGRIDIGLQSDKSFLDLVSQTDKVIPISPGSFAPVAIGGTVQLDNQMATLSQFVCVMVADSEKLFD